MPSSSVRCASISMTLIIPRQSTSTVEVHAGTLTVELLLIREAKIDLRAVSNYTAMLELHEANIPRMEDRRISWFP